MQAWLVFCGPNRPGFARLVKPWSLQVGQHFPLTLRHSHRWGRADVTRVILGSDPAWADAVLVDEPLTIPREQARFYLRHAAPETSDFRAMKNCPLKINGQPHAPFEWINLRAGDEIELGHWRFRYEYQL